MTREEIELLRQCKPGTHLRILTHHSKGYAASWWKRPENLQQLQRFGVVIRDGEGCVFSANRGFTGNVLIGECKALGWGKEAGVTLYNAKVRLWKDGEPEHAIRIARSRRHAAHAGS